MYILLFKLENAISIRAESAELKYQNRLDAEIK